MLSLSLNANKVPLTGISQLEWITRRLQVFSHPKTRHLDRRTAEALDHLAHAIEYLEDTMPLMAEENTRTKSTNEAISLLKALNRSIFVAAQDRR